MASNDPIGKFKEKLVEVLSASIVFQDFCGISQSWDPVLAAKQKIIFSQKVVGDSEKWTVSELTKANYNGALIWMRWPSGFSIESTTETTFSCSYSVGIRFDAFLPDSVIVKKKVVKGAAIDWMELEFSKLSWDLAKRCRAAGMAFRSMRESTVNIGEAEETNPSPLAYAMCVIDFGER